ncbi:hypothetical protein COT75_04395 [Candidatus Beckwithbacteria bacterium CG10_big_fil_rev_8_21_14_0_10_34_10]|uniref:Uncharacterized protein n=1 Tax=Candidatus Beckwithbacteria bacterium CG10_big_fil_rev_8_21_14_0_10_34_10 TaxID=1974495 RepID=A0A2H0WAF6_9BACT|nr:MAG: hypothetical protein COT75_04395 [Candidatus Beckwithbacteria bacterium CG10_big_fil_rev_8_21_14_0_10_34_10]
MNKFNTKQLLQILPLDENLRKKVVTNFDSFSEDQKLALKKLSWIMFFELYTNKIKEEFEKTLYEISQEKGDLKANLYQEIEENVLNKLKQILLQKADKKAVEKIRAELKKQVELS